VELETSRVKYVGEHKKQ